MIISPTNQPKSLKQQLLLFLFPEFEFKYISKNLSLLAKEGKIKTALDFGCGPGRFLDTLRNHGVQYTGVDISKSVRDYVRERGAEALSPEEFTNSTKTFDCIIMSQIIEHFNHHELLKLFEMLIPKLNKGGYLVIATPCYMNTFYSDFDHVKPYNPASIIQTLAGTSPYFHFGVKIKFKLFKLWYQRRSFCWHHVSWKYTSRLGARVCMLFDIFMAVLFKLSAGIIGENYTWVMFLERAE